MQHLNLYANDSDLSTFLLTLKLKIKKNTEWINCSTILNTYAYVCIFVGESTHEHATDNLTLFSPFASKIQIKPKFNLSGILPWLNNNLILLGPKRRLGYLAQEYWVSQTL